MWSCLHKQHLYDKFKHTQASADCDTYMIRAKYKQLLRHLEHKQPQLFQFLLQTLSILLHKFLLLPPPPPGLPRGWCGGWCPHSGHHHRRRGEGSTGSPSLDLSYRQLVFCCLPKAPYIHPIGGVGASAPFQVAQQVAFPTGICCYMLFQQRESFFQVMQDVLDLLWHHLVALLPVCSSLPKAPVVNLVGSASPPAPSRWHHKFPC